jgi:hypothetical protein
MLNIGGANIVQHGGQRGSHAVARPSAPLAWARTDVEMAVQEIHVVDVRRSPPRCAAVAQGELENVTVPGAAEYHFGR